MSTKKYTIIDAGVAACSCGRVDCGDPEDSGFGYARMIGVDGTVFVHPFMDDKYSSPYTVGEIVYLEEDEVFEED